MFSLQVLLSTSRVYLAPFSISMLFSCSEAEPKGSDCYDQFATMQECFARYPTVYNKSGSPDDDDDDSKHLVDAANLGATQSNVDTVDQLEETDKTASAKSDSSTEQTTANNKR